MKTSKILQSFSIIILLAFVGISPLMAQTNVVRISPEAKLPKNYITYYLPQTQIIVDVTVKKTIQKSGKFANYANRFLGIDDVIIADKTYFEIEKISMTIGNLPDTSKHYAVEIHPKSIAYKLQKDKNDVIYSVNSSLSQEESKVKYNGEKIDTTINFDYSQIDEDMLLATTNAKMAELVAAKILRIRESRIDILTDNTEHGYDGDAMKQMLDNLQETENSLTELFTGKSVSITEKRQFTFTPSQNMLSDILFRFSSILGILEKDNLAGYPIRIAVESINYPKIIEPTKKDKKFGIFYNIAGNGKIKIYDINKIWINEVVTMPQFGYTKYFPSNIFNKSNITIKFTKYGTIDSVK